MRHSRRLVVDSPDPGWKDIATYSGLAYAGILSWLGKIAWSRIDAKADRAELQRALDAMAQRDEEARESRIAIHQKLDLTIADATRTAVAVARLEGTIDRGRRAD